LDYGKITFWEKMSTWDGKDYDLGFMRNFDFFGILFLGQLGSIEFSISNKNPSISKNVLKVFHKKIKIPESPQGP
jgi:hypothetical protein